MKTSEKLYANWKAGLYTLIKNLSDDTYATRGHKFTQFWIEELTFLDRGTYIPLTPIQYGRLLTTSRLRNSALS